MFRRQSIVARVLKELREGRFIVSVSSSDPEYDQEHIGRMFKRRGESVRISKDPDGGKLIFSRKNKK